MSKNVSTGFGIKKHILFVSGLILSAALTILLLVTFNHPQKPPKNLETIFGDKTYATFVNYTKENGVEKAYKLLKERFPGNEPQAHDFAHVIGLAAYDEKGVGGLGMCDTFYNYGCFHGFVEGFLTSQGVGAIGQVEGSCLSLGKVHAPSCLHGIGHGVLANRSYKLEEALLDCDRLKQAMRIYCWDGVFMERVTGSMLASQDRPVLTENTLEKPCILIPRIYRKQCWRNQVTLWFAYFQGNTQSMAKQCNSIEKESQEICFESIGNMVAMTAPPNLESIVSLCTVLGPPKGQSLSNNQVSSPCLVGAMNELMFEGKSPALAEGLCSFVASHLKKNCRLRFTKLLSEYQTRFNRRT